MTLTPKQFNLLATKNDLKAFATKDDLKALENSTKNDLKTLENRIDRMDNKMGKMFLAAKDDSKTLEEKIDNKFDKKMDKILTVLDDIAAQLKTSNEEKTANQGAHDRMQKNIDKHEIRIKKLELSPAQFAH